MNVYLTGASGFVGSHVLEKLGSKSDVTVTSLSRSTTGKGTSRLIRGDLSSKTDVDAFLSGPGVLVHLAYANAPLEEHLAIVGNLVNRAKEVGIRRVVHCSTAVVVGRANGDVITESTLPVPVTDYERTKLAIEREFENLASDGIDLFIVRPTAVFGHGGLNAIKIAQDRRRNSRLRNYLLDCVYGRRSLNLVEVDYVADAIIRLALSEFPNAKRPIRETIILEADEAPENQYLGFSAWLDREWQLKRLPLPRLPLDIVLPLLMTFLGKKTNPRRRFKSLHASKWGLQPTHDLKPSLARFLRTLDSQSS